MACQHRASLIVTRDVDGTSTSVARQRIALACALPEGHAGPHQDGPSGREWSDKGKHLTHILQHQEED